ncbi:MAG: rhodanese-like domain-containing protein [Sphaerochaetaceae bacterium]|nr:rhodanese-like domain-containing protein [Sphaerochaetaceae bacterium]
MRKVILILLTVVVLSAVSCAKGSGEEASYRQVSAAEAKRLMEVESSYVILDVRTQEEYEESHIPGAVVLPYDEVPSRAQDLLKDKNQLILVYCRSGNRSRKASQSLVNLGYKNVVEFGGINSWPYEVVR